MMSLRRSLLAILLAGFLVGLFCGGANAGRRLKRRLGVTLGYPYAGLKINPHPAFSIEPRAAFEKDILIGGGRLYVNLSRSRYLVLFTAFEGDYVTFSAEDEDTGERFTGSGHIGGVFLGGEVLIRRLSFTLDFGGVYSFAKSGEFDASGFDLVANLGVIIYLF
jgi:hypothetical protein